MARPAIDLIKQRFGKLVVVKRALNKDSKNACWQCHCDCGMDVDVRAHSLKSGQTKSCGCLQVDKLVARSTTHGQSKTRAFKIWTGLRRRVRDPRLETYANYGGRGITVCDQWSNFEQFYKDMGDPPFGCSIDRIDNSKGYSKENCRWATNIEQARNKRTNVNITFQGETMCLSAWAERKGIPSELAYNRYYRGWHPWYALNVPVGIRLKAWLQEQKAI